MDSKIVKFKKTALDDDAAIYQRSKDTITKEELKNLPFRQKLGYYKDYYLKITIGIIIAAVLIFSILNTTIFNRSECRLSLCFLDGTLPERSEEMDSFFEEAIGLENKNDFIHSDTYVLGNYQMEMAYRTRLMARAIDLVVCPRDVFLEQSEQGLFCDLRELLPADMYAQLSDLMIENKIAETDDAGDVVSYSEPMPMGIDLSGSNFYKEYGGLLEQPVLCVTWNPENKGNVLKAITYFTGIDVSLSETEEASEEASSE